MFQKKKIPEKIGSVWDDVLWNKFSIKNSKEIDRHLVIVNQIKIDAHVQTIKCYNIEEEISGYIAGRDDMFFGMRVNIDFKVTENLDPDFSSGQIRTVSMTSDMYVAEIDIKLFCSKDIYDSFLNLFMRARALNLKHFPLWITVEKYRRADADHFCMIGNIREYNFKQTLNLSLNEDQFE